MVEPYSPTKLLNQPIDSHLVANALKAEFIVYNPKEEAGLLPKRIEKGLFGCSRREQTHTVQADFVRKIVQGGEHFVFQIGALLKVFTSGDLMTRFKFVQYLELNDPGDEFVISPRGGLIFTYSNTLRKAQIFSYDENIERFVKYPIKYQRSFSDIVMARFTKDENLLILTHRVNLIECVLEDEIFSSEDSSMISSDKGSRSKEVGFSDAIKRVKEFKFDATGRTVKLDFSQDADDFVIYEKELGSRITRKLARSKEPAKEIFDLSRLKDDSDLVRFRSFKGDAFIFETQKFIHLISQARIAASIQKNFLQKSDSEEYLMRIIENNLLHGLARCKDNAFLYSLPRNVEEIAAD